MWPMRSLGLIFLEVQKSGARLTVSSPMKRTPLWSKVQGAAPNILFQVAPMSRYQSCSPGMNTFLIVTSLSSSAPELQLHRIPELRQIAAEDHEVGRRVHRLHFLERAHGLLHEARVHVLRVEVGVRDPGELERLRRPAPKARSRVLLRVGNQTEGRRPRRPYTERLVQERAPGDANRLRSGCSPDRTPGPVHLTSYAFAFAHLCCRLIEHFRGHLLRPPSLLLLSSMGNFTVSSLLTVTAISGRPV